VWVVARIAGNFRTPATSYTAEVALHCLSARKNQRGTVTGHASAGGAFPADVDFLNREISGFFDW
jgi:hypothetical protein